jgi:hypothetical protein
MSSRRRASGGPSAERPPPAHRRFPKKKLRGSTRSGAITATLRRSRRPRRSVGQEEAGARGPIERGQGGGAGAAAARSSATGDARANRPLRTKGEEGRRMDGSRRLVLPATTTRRRLRRKGVRREASVAEALRASCFAARQSHTHYPTGSYFEQHSGLDVPVFPCAIPSVRILLPCWDMLYILLFMLCLLTRCVPRCHRQLGEGRDAAGGGETPSPSRHATC